MLLDFSNLIKKYNCKTHGIAHFGAHHGQELDEYLLIGFNEIHLFEPQTKAFKILQSKIKINENVFVYNYGLGSKNENFELNIDTGDGQSSSILKPHLHIELYPYIEFKEKEIIKVKRFDCQNLTNVNFLNLDIQGYELEALRGCESALKNQIEYIYTEVNRKELYRDCCLIHEIDVFLRRFDFLRVKTKWWNTLTPWGDSFYVRKSKLGILSKVKFYINKMLFLEKTLLLSFDIIYYFKQCTDTLFSFFTKVKRRLLGLFSSDKSI